MTFHWYSEIADQINVVEDPCFPETLHASFRKALKFDLMLMVLFRKAGTPELVFHNFPAGKPQRALDTYIKSTFVLDPFYQSFVADIKAGVYLMGDLAPDSFFEGEYFKQHNVVVNQMEESGFLTHNWPGGLTELGLFIALPDKNYIVISLYRKQAAPTFSAATVRRLRLLFPVVQSLLVHHYNAILKPIQSAKVGVEASGSPVQEVFSSFGKPILSDRESQIMQLVLKGHSSESIGHQLYISSKTVKTHRRNCYTKLRISSQAELLSLFLDSLGERMK